MQQFEKDKKLKGYLSFCNYFQKYNLPLLRFKEITKEYKYVYRIIYGVNEEDICKASFIVFLFLFLPTTLIFFLIINLEEIFLNVFYSILFGLIISIISAYYFNMVLYKTVKKEEKVINALSYLIKINFSLKKSIQHERADTCMTFIKLMMDYKLPISELFRHIFGRIHLGFVPEEELELLVTPSKDFNIYISELLIKNFGYNTKIDYYNESSAEKNFRILIKSLDTKIGIIFFIGLFFPLILCTFILFQQVKLLFVLFITPLLLVFMYWMFKKLVRVNTVLIGVLDEYSRTKEQQFSEFLQFLESLALNLKNSYSPEVAFIKAWTKNKSQFPLLNETLNTHISSLISLQYTFEDLINQLKITLASPRYKIILDVIHSMLENSAYYSSEKINDIIQIIERHRTLEDRFKTIIRGKRFIVKIFIFLFPVILGTLGGMLPLVISIVKNLENIEEMQNINHMYELMDFSDVIIIFCVLFVCIIITCYYFLKIVRHKRISIMFYILSFIFIIAFIQSFMYGISFL
ncbi:MAG: hypothetical protein ACFFBP_06735 [Promethearchaeota archaeon]